MRLAWFRGADLNTSPPQPLGIYTYNGGTKTFPVAACKNFPALQTTHTAIADAYSTLALGANGFPGVMYIGCY